jgi:hypothetical protein
MAKALTEAAKETEEAWTNIELPTELKNTGELSLNSAKAIQNDIESLFNGAKGQDGVD